MLSKYLFSLAMIGLIVTFVFFLSAPLAGGITTERYQCCMLAISFDALLFLATGITGYWERSL
jgi:hypothetical protein